MKLPLYWKIPLLKACSALTPSVKGVSYTAFKQMWQRLAFVFCACKQIVFPTKHQILEKSKHFPKGAADPLQTFGIDMNP